MAKRHLHPDPFRVESEDFWNGYEEGRAHREVSALIVGIGIGGVGTMVLVALLRYLFTLAGGL